ncbi:MAG TPA: rod shape-determining protein MreC [Candidatus Limnocylindrales bacterium]|nr:rod shape-determining protein MreC [Candidatus Limnocylindrales bacterium]
MTTGGLLATRASRRRWIAFSILVAISLGLMAFSSSPPIRELQRGLGFALRPFQSAADGAAASVAAVVETLAEIDRLQAENRALRAENERLRAENGRLAALRRENEQLTGLLQTRSGLDFQTVAARIIARESAEFRRVVTLDRGTDDGIALDDVVIGAGGALVGRVVDVGPTFSRVLLITDTSSTVIGQLAASGATGEVVGQLGGVLVMQNIDSTATVTVGDEVVTAGIELGGGVRSRFPKGLLIGLVVDVRRESNAVVQTAFLEPALDLDTLEYALVITDYEGGLPTPEELPTSETNPDGTLPEGERPFVPPGSAAPGASSRP